MTKPPSFTHVILCFVTLFCDYGMEPEEVVSEPQNSVEIESLKVQFVLGEKFDSYEQLKAKISVYEKCNSVQLVYNDSRTLEAAKKRAPNRVSKANERLVLCTLCACLAAKSFKAKALVSDPIKGTGPFLINCFQVL